jgi:hypothetical protein
MSEEVDKSLRSLLRTTPAVVFALTVPAASLAQPQQKEQKQNEVTPTEDLMREHGLLKRILLVYEEVGSRIAQQREFPQKCGERFGQDHSFIHRAVSREA